MILKKPYAFFIKMFKPIHLVLALIVAYLIFLENRILTFLNGYMYSSIDTSLKNIKGNLANNFIFIIPMLIIVLSLLILGVMFRKKKPVLFYFINIFIFIVSIIINLYVSNFLGVLEQSVVSIRIVKLMHDLLFINIMLQSVMFIFLIIRGMGINFKKFDFSNDISKFEINESDDEEFELDINIDLDENKRKRKKNLRYLKYTYIENKFIINIVLIIFVIILSLVIYGIIKVYYKNNKEGKIYSANTFSFGVNETLILNRDYSGRKLTDNYLIVVNTSIASNYQDNILYLKDFSLKIGNAVFKPVTDYAKSLIDIGNVYNETVLPFEYTNYLFVYEIPEKFKTSDMIFSYSNEGKSIDIKLKPKEQQNSDIIVEKSIGEEMQFNESIGDIKFEINDFEIKDRYLVEYNYCINDNDCILSKEYLVASINENFDKYILRLDINYNDNSSLKLSDFYDLLEGFGSIQYKINDSWIVQSDNFEEIKSSKANMGNNIYIGVNSEVMNATNIKFVFNIRGSRYEYTIK